ncbi:MAG: hybrid sensor histidine kinase/response regulator [Verrucomicrobiae bacterium]|nr:hybrid sensor histidine kinase/response regulator [Verrucomicrobiae bacterium]
MNGHPGSSAATPIQDPPARILVVDDQPATIQLAGTVLGKLGHEIVPAANGPTALRRLGLHPPDLILLDLLMPEMDGCELCRRIRDRPEWRDIPVIFLSAADDPDLVVKALEAGGTDYVTKPFHQAELILRVRTQLALKFARDRLARLAEDKDELLGILAHDLKNHLGGMQMSAQLLHDRVIRQGDNRLIRLADNLRHASDRMLGFVRGFLANMAADRESVLPPGTVDLAAVTRTVTERNLEAARRKGIAMQTHLPGHPVKGYGHAESLDRVLDNLISNAIKFSPPGRMVEVSVEDHPDWIECRVRDQGPGFQPEDRARLFQRYGRLSARPTAGEPSTGLGLAISHKLVTAMHGEIRVEGEPGEGARITVRLPRRNVP